MRVGSLYFPILVLHLNNGTEIANGDLISEASVTAIHNAFASQVSIGDMIVGDGVKRIAFPSIQENGTYTLASYTFPESYPSDLLRGHTFSIKKKIATAGTYMTSIYTKLYIDNTAQPTPEAAHHEAYNSQNRWLSFGPLHLIYDDVGDRFLYADTGNFDLNESYFTDYNKIGIINYTEIPIAAAVINTSATGAVYLGFASERCDAFLKLNVGSYSYDPYYPVQPASTGGGRQPYNPFETDDIGYNLLPEVSAVGTGFISLWSPTEQQMLNLSGYMWNANPTTLAFWKKLVADPLELVYGLNIVPLNLKSFNIVGPTPEDVVVGMWSTGVKMDYLTSQWVELDCGSINIDESLLGSYMDYDPYTRMEIYLPYIGYRPLKVDDFMPGSMKVKYKIDLLTGTCVAQIKSTKSNLHSDELDSIVYQFMGNCATQVPVTASQYADAVRSAITTAAAIGSIALMAGAGAGAVASGGASIMPVAEPAGLLSGPGMVPVESELYNSMFRYTAMTSIEPNSVTGAVNSLKNVGTVHAGAAAASNVMGIKPSVERSGAIGGSAGILSTQTPYVVFTRPRIAHPENQNTYTGYPSFMTKKLSELKGFTQIQEIHLEGLACTSSELAELDALLKSGVIF